MPETHPEHELRQGQVFAGRYRIEKLLGEGDRKRTYLAEDVLVEHRMVAVAVVRSTAVQDDPDGTRREAKVLSQVGNHPNLVGFHDLEPDATPQYLVFEYLSGGTLTDLVEGTAHGGAPFNLETILRYGRQLARALSHIHQAGIVHRDISPDNIWLDERQEAHVGDFDSAVPLGTDAGLGPVTTLAYASPEECEGGRVDERSDLFSLGAVLVSLALSQLRVDDPTRLHKERPDLPSSLTGLLTRLVSPSPDDRPCSAEDVLQRLNEIRRDPRVDSIIARGEGPQVEFKSSMRFPRGEVEQPPEHLPEDVREKALQRTLDGHYATLEKMVMKTIAAFLNSTGGTLLVGVDNDGLIVGIEDDYATFDEVGTRDIWQLNLRQKVLNQLDVDVWATVGLFLEETDHGTVARIECPRRSQPTWVTTSDGKQEFYIRAGSGTDLIPPAAWGRYISEHWPA